MPRRNIFAVLACALGLQAQRRTPRVIEIDEAWLAQRNLPTAGCASPPCEGKPPQKDQCPVCGTVAAPYVRQTEKQAFGSGVCLADGDRPQLLVCRTPSDTELTGPMERVTRCLGYIGDRRCNAAFWQDAEK